MSIGICLSPNHNILSQKYNAADKIGILGYVMDYREWFIGEDNRTNLILFTTPVVLYNDIVKHSNHPKFQLISWIIADECHHSSAKTWNTIFMNLPNAVRSYGFSASPFELSSHLSINFAGMSIEDAMTVAVVGPIIYEKTVKELRDFLNIPTLINLHYEWPKNRWADQKSDDWHSIRALMYENKERIALIASVIRLLIEKDYNVITHVAEKEFGIELLDKVSSNKCVCWYGGKETITSNGEKLTVESLREQAGTDILSMICTSHAIEGLDLDSPLNAIVLIDGKKPRQILQKCGRITRPDKRPSVIINLMDHGLLVLPRHSKERSNTILEEFDSDVYDIRSIEQLIQTLNLIDGKFANETDKTMVQNNSS